jgi:hypothetical protein
MVPAVTANDTSASAVTGPYRFEMRSATMTAAVSESRLVTR